MAWFYFARFAVELDGDRIMSCEGQDETVQVQDLLYVIKTDL